MAQIQWVGQRNGLILAAQAAVTLRGRLQRVLGVSLSSGVAPFTSSQFPELKAAGES